MKKISYEQFDEQLDRYLRHDMTAEEESEFKALLDSDSELKQRAQLTALMIKSMHKSKYSEDEQKEDKILVDTIKNMDKEKFLRLANQKPAKVVRFWPRFISYAAAACAVGIIIWRGFIMYENHLTVSLGDSQYMAYVQDISDVQYVRGTNDTEIVDKLQPLFANVKEGKDIKHTISELETLYKESLNEDSDYNDFCDDLAWNLAIAYLKDGDREKSISILQEMVDRSPDYPQISQPAQNLIKQIKGL